MNTDFSNDIKVIDIMRSDIIRTKGSTPITTCAKLMLNNNVGSVLIDYDKILTKTDILRSIGEGDLGLITANEIASSPLITCHFDETLENAMRKMTKKKIEKLVVTDGDKIIGIISSMDVLRTAPGLFEIKRQELLLNRNSEGSYYPKQEIEGHCEDCGNYEPVLNYYSGILLCKDCLEDREGMDEIEE
ncbi:MAG: CBS domain-containing protein [Candidatus Hodarchaeales archaeon]